MNETIKIGFRDVGNFPDALHFISGDIRHSFIVYTDSGGQKFLFSGFPEPTNVNHPLNDGDNVQELLAQWVPYNSAAYDYDFVDDPNTLIFHAGNRG